MYSESSTVKLIYLLSDLFTVLLACIGLSFKYTLPYLDSVLDIVVTAFVSVFLVLIANNYSRIHLAGLRELFWLSVKFIWKFLVTILLVQFAKEVILKSANLSITLDVLSLQLIVVFLSIFASRLIVYGVCRDFLSSRQKVLLISSKEKVIDMVKQLENAKFSVTAIFTKDQLDTFDIPILTDLSGVRNFLTKNELNEVFVSSESRDDYYTVQKHFQDIGLPVSISLVNENSHNRRKYSLTSLPHQLFLTSSLNISPYRYMLLKRAADVVFALLGLFLVSLTYLLIYPIVQRQSKGPMIFKQKRVGQNGRVFELYKFRSMYLDAEERKEDLLSKNQLSSDYMFKMDNDPRIFPFGQKLRDWSIDELPQFINVLKGDMSLIGTRPPTLEEYYKYDFRHFKRLAMKPGITGMWQVSGRSNITDFEEVVALDTYYIENWSLWLDIKIFLKTIVVVLKRDGSK
ncbi:sugar transferase [Streptococcus hyovaginalis]